MGALSGRSAALITTTASTSGTYAGTLADGADRLALIQSGNGTLTLSGSNTYSGGTTLNSVA